MIWKIATIILICIIIILLWAIHQVGNSLWAIHQVGNSFTKFLDTFFGGMLQTKPKPKRRQRRWLKRNTQD